MFLRLELMPYYWYGFSAGESGPVARQAHNLKAMGSNPIPATSWYNEVHAGIAQLVRARDS